MSFSYEDDRQFRIAQAAREERAQAERPGAFARCGDCKSLCMADDLDEYGYCAGCVEDQRDAEAEDARRYDRNEILAAILAFEPGA